MRVLREMANISQVDYAGDVHVDPPKISTNGNLFPSDHICTLAKFTGSGIGTGDWNQGLVQLYNRTFQCKSTTLCLLS